MPDLRGMRLIAFGAPSAVHVRLIDYVNTSGAAICPVVMSPKEAQAMEWWQPPVGAGERTMVVAEVTENPRSVYEGLFQKIQGFQHFLCTTGLPFIEKNNFLPEISSEAYIEHLAQSYEPTVQHSTFIVREAIRHIGYGGYGTIVVPRVYGSNAARARAFERDIEALLGRIAPEIKEKKLTITVVFFLPETDPGHAVVAALTRPKAKDPWVPNYVCIDDAVV